MPTNVPFLRYLRELFKEYSRIAYLKPPSHVTGYLAVHKFRESQIILAQDMLQYAAFNLGFYYEGSGAAFWEKMRTPKLSYGLRRVGRKAKSLGKVIHARDFTYPMGSLHKLKFSKIYVKPPLHKFTLRVKRQATPIEITDIEF